MDSGSQHALGHFSPECVNTIISLAQCYFHSKRKLYILCQGPLPLPLPMPRWLAVHSYGPQAQIPIYLSCTYRHRMMECRFRTVAAARFENARDRPTLTWPTGAICNLTSFNWEWTCTHSSLLSWWLDGKLTILIICQSLSTSFDCFLFRSRLPDERGC